MSRITRDDRSDTPDRHDRQARPARKGGGTLHWHLGLWSLVLVLFVSIFAAWSSLSLSGRVIALPDWVRTEVRERLNEGLPAGSVTLQAVEFGVTPRGRPRLRLVNVGLRDETGLDIAQLNAVDTGVRVSGLLRGRYEPSILTLSGAQVTLRRFADGSFALSFGQGLQAAGSLDAILSAVDSTFATGVLAQADRLEASELTITIEDSRSGRIWQVTDGHLSVTQADDLLDVTVTFAVFNQTENLAETVFNFQSPIGTNEATIAARFENAAAADIAAQSPALAFLSVLDAPISGAILTELDEHAAVTSLQAELSLGAGALSPAQGAAPVAFDEAELALAFDPARGRVEVPRFAFASDLGALRGSGHVDLAEYNRGFPESFIGQVALSEARLEEGSFGGLRFDVDEGYADFRMRLDPFTLDLGQLALVEGERRLTATGEVAARRDGWHLAIDGATGALSRDEVLAFWPEGAGAGARRWVDQNVLDGSVDDVRLALRLAPGRPLHIEAGMDLLGATIRVLPDFPPVTNASGYLSISGRELTIVGERGIMETPDGGAIDLSGTVYSVADMSRKPGRARLDLALDGPLPSVLSVIALEPLNVMAEGNLSASDFGGQARASGWLDFPTAPGSPPDAFDYRIEADLTGVRSAALVEGQLVTSDRLQLTATPGEVRIGGDGRLGDLPVTGTWSLPVGAEANGVSRFTGTATISPGALAGLGVALPGGWLSGSGPAEAEVIFPPGAPPELTVLSDLSGLTMSVPELSWRKGPDTTGSLRLAATLAETPRVTDLALNAAGLVLEGGEITLNEAGLDTARFARARAGSWFDGALVVTGRGPGQPVAISVPSGSVDMTRADFGPAGLGGGSGSGSGSGGAGGGASAPLTLALDRLKLGESIVFENMDADLDRAGGLNGNFTARVEGGGSVRGTLRTVDTGLSMRILSDTAGAVLRNTGIYRSARGGQMELLLTPTGAEGSYDGSVRITGTRITDAPTVTELLSALSVVGLLEQLDGQGLSFSEIDAEFSVNPRRATLYNLSAIGVSLGLSLDGYYRFGTQELDMQGVLSPLYLVNGLGRAVSSRDGEGLIGFNFTLSGPASDVQVTVNPLSVLTPGVFRDLFRRPAPTRRGATLNEDAQ